MLKDCVGIRANACKPPAKTFTSSSEGEKKLTVRLDVFFINFLKEIIGAKPEVDMVHRGAACQGPAHVLYMRMQPSSSAVAPRCDAEEKRTCVSSRHRHESALQRHTANCTQS